MNKIFNNDINLKKAIEDICAVAIKDTCNTLLEILKDLIISEFYNEYNPKYYERTYQFYDSAITKMLNSCLGIIMMDESTMTYDGEWNGIKQLKMAAEGFHGGYNIQTDGRYWDEFIEYCENNVFVLLKTNLKKYGLNIN